MKTALRLLRRLLPPDSRDSIESYFEEMVERISTEKGPRRARLWLWAQIFRSIPGFFSHALSWQWTLLKTHFRVTSRQILRHKGLFLIKIFGLAAGLGCATVIVLYVADELTYDRFHPGSERIYRITTRRVSQIGDFQSPTSPGPLATAVRADFPQAEKIARVISPLENSDHVLAVQGENRFFERRAWFVDPEIFDVLSVPFVQGDRRTALIEPRTAVLTQSTARKYFGDSPALGRTIRLELDYDTDSSKLEDFQVRGVVRDAPANTHWKYDILISMATMTGVRPDLDTNWREFHVKYAYVKLIPGADPGAFEKQLNVYADAHRNELPDTRLLEFRLQPVRSIHLATPTIAEMEMPGNRAYILIYSLVALLVLLIGVMNYVNLSASMSTTRIRETGIRKVVGGRRRDLVFQFLTESALITFLAFLLALVFSSFLLRYFNRMAGTGLTLDGLLRPAVAVPLVLLLAAVVLAAGGYPAMILSSFHPVDVLAGRNRGKKGAGVQRFLVVGQFAVSIFLVVSTLVVFRQLDFMKGRSLGFTRADKLILDIKSDQPGFRRDYESIKGAFSRCPAVTGAAVSSVIPGIVNRSGYYLKRGETYENAEKPARLKVITVDAAFIDLYGLAPAAGRLFQSSSGGDRTGSYIVNETGARLLGFATPQDALGTRLTAHYHRLTKSIVGVVKDFHFLGMKDAIDPVLFDIEPSLFRYVTLSFAPGRSREVADFAEKTWRERFPGVPFEYTLLDESFQQIYHYEEQMGRLLGLVTGLGLAAAFLGLFGLVSFYSRRRRKEIAVRKVIGAPSIHIVTLLSRRFVVLIAAAGLLAVPAAWWAANAWLQGFAYRIKPGIPVFLFALAVSILTALAAVLFQGLKATRSQPADVLRHE